MDKENNLLEEPHSLLITRTSRAYILFSIPEVYSASVFMSWAFFCRTFFNLFDPVTFKYFNVALGTLIYNRNRMPSRG